MPPKIQRDWNRKEYSEKLTPLSLSDLKTNPGFPFLFHPLIQNRFSSFFSDNFSNISFLLCYFNEQIESLVLRSSFSIICYRLLLTPIRLTADLAGISIRLTADPAGISDSAVVRYFFHSYFNPFTFFLYIYLSILWRLGFCLVFSVVKCWSE